MLMNSGDILRGPEFQAAYDDRLAKIKKLDPNADVAPRKWGHPALRLMDQQLERLQNEAAAARPPTPGQKERQDINALQNKVATQMADMTLKGMVNYDMPSMKLLDETHSHEERLSRLRVVKHKLDDIWAEEGLTPEQRARKALIVARKVEKELGEQKAADDELGAMLMRMAEEFTALRKELKDCKERIGHLEQLQAHH